MNKLSNLSTNQKQSLHNRKPNATDEERMALIAFLTQRHQLGRGAISLSKIPDPMPLDGKRVNPILPEWRVSQEGSIGTETETRK